MESKQVSDANLLEKPVSSNSKMGKSNCQKNEIVRMRKELEFDSSPAINKKAAEDQRLKVRWS